MKICIFLSGHIRTLFYKFHENLLLIKEKVGDCEIDVFYSFWEDYGRSDSINDPWHYKADDFVQQVVNHENIISYLRGCGGANNVSGEIEPVGVMKEVIEKTHFSPEANGKNALSSQYGIFICMINNHLKEIIFYLDHGKEQKKDYKYLTVNWVCGILILFI